MSYMKTPNTLKQEKSETFFVSEEIKDNIKIDFEYLDSYEENLKVTIAIEKQVFYCDFSFVDFEYKKLKVKSEREDFSFYSLKSQEIYFDAINFGSEKIIINKKLSLDKISRINNNIFLEYTIEE